MARLLKEREGETYYKDVKVEDSPESLKGLLNETRWEILKLFAERPRYPAEVADELGMHEQKVYYHVRNLEEDGLIEVVDRREKAGAVAKYYTVTDHAYALELPYGDERLADFSLAEEPEQLRSFLHPFVANGEVNADIVVGSPDPHGPHQVRSRDAHLASDLSLFLGQYGSFDGMRTVEDVDVKGSGEFSSNMILLGGPLTNLATEKFNAHLPVKFETENFPFRKLVSESTGNVYEEDSQGFIARAPNPEDAGSHVLVLAGVRMKGTRAAVMSLVEGHEEVLEDYEGEDKWGTVVQGRDMDGDGEIDEIEVLE
ncbi:MAG: helix-turn-helix domain-containing protein [Candidatus Nanohaloarchaea archaeon]|nr:helix-turn-helix domain-containing protein [Candidatus Nanohaloarchaea archaeon]